MSKPPHADMKMPKEYEEMMRAYLPKVPMALIKDAWKHNATPSEAMAYRSHTKEQGK